MSAARWLLAGLLGCAEPPSLNRVDDLGLDQAIEGPVDATRSADQNPAAPVDHGPLPDAAHDLGVPLDRPWRCSTPPTEGAAGEGPCEIEIVLQEPRVTWPEEGSLSEHTRRHRSAVLGLSACGTRLHGRCSGYVRFVWSGQGQKTGFPLDPREDFFDSSFPYSGGPRDNPLTPYTLVLVTGPPDVYEIWLEVTAFAPLPEEGGTPEDAAAPPIRRRAGPILFELAPLPDAGVP